MRKEMEEREAKLFSKIGQLHEELDAMKTRFGKLIGVVADIVRGEISLDRVMVNLTDQQVIWSPLGERPAMPATINGLPVCVVAPDKPPKDEPN